MRSQAALTIFGNGQMIRTLFTFIEASVDDGL